MNSLSRMLITSLFALSLLSACIVQSRHGGVGVLVPPPLPVIVELGPDRHYHHDGYDYYYVGDRWQYSRDRGAERYDLPRSHWPREIRRRGDWR
ncbi:MAG: hypothetical protein M0023_14915 [Desulfobacteraceae bacterium]|nr:hypothetical protein [Desulfobacteraceae bacterium]